MARWKARGRFHISANWTVFASYHDWGTMSRYWSKLRCLKGGWVTLNANFREKGASPPTIFGIRTLESLSYGTVKKNCRKLLPAEYGAPTLQTDRRQTDGRWHIANVNVSSRPLKITTKKQTKSKRSTLCLSACVDNNYIAARYSTIMLSLFSNVAEITVIVSNKSK